MRRVADRDHVVLAAVVVCGAALRFSTLGARSFWVDEAATVTVLRHGFGGMLHEVIDRENTPPLYYVLAWLWAQAFGTHEAGLRAFSALVGTATIPVMWAIGRRLAGRSAGLAAAALAAAAPVLVWHAQDARAYALLVLLAAGSFLCFLRAHERPDAGRLGAWAAVSALALATHYYAAFLVVTEAVWLIHAHRHARGPLVAAAAVTACGAALLPVMMAQNGQAGDFVENTSLITRAIEVPGQLVAGYQPPLQVVSSAVAALLVAFALWRAYGLAAGAVRRALTLATAVSAVALAVPVVLAPAGIDHVYARYLIAAWPPLCAVVAAGLTLGPSRVAGHVTLAALLGLSVAIDVTTASDPKFEHDDWRTAFHALGGAPAGGRAVVISPSSGGLPLRVYRPATRAIPSGATAVREIAVIGLPPPYRTIGHHPEPPALRPAPPPAGFRIVQAHRAATFTMVRYRATRAQAVTQSQLRPLALVHQDPALRLEPAPADP